MSDETSANLAAVERAVEGVRWYRDDSPLEYIKAKGGKITMFKGIIYLTDPGKKPIIRLLLKIKKQADKWKFSLNSKILPSLPLTSLMTNLAGNILN